MVFHIAAESEDLDLVAVNASYPAETLAHLLNYDTTHGRWRKRVEPAGDSLVIDGKRSSSQGKGILKTFLGTLLASILSSEATGAFNHGDKAIAHVKAGARKVLLTAPAKGGDVQTIVLGVNEQEIDTEGYDVFSNASHHDELSGSGGKVLNDEYGITNGLMTTVMHSQMTRRILTTRTKT